MRYRFLSVMILLVAVTSSAWAQDSDSWEWSVIPYLWGVNMDGDMAVGPIDADLDVSFSDILSDLDIGGSLATRFKKGSHGFHVDYTYLRLKPDNADLPSPPFFPGSNAISKEDLKLLLPLEKVGMPGRGGMALAFGRPGVAKLRKDRFSLSNSVLFPLSSVGIMKNLLRSARLSYA